MSKYQALDHAILRRLKKSSASSSGMSSYAIADELTKAASQAGMQTWVLLARRLQVLRKQYSITADKSTGLWSLTQVGLLRLQLSDIKHGR